MSEVMKRASKKKTTAVKLAKAGVARPDDLARQLEGISRSMAMIEFDMEGQILDANSNFLSALGYAKEEILGKHHRIFVDASYAAGAEYRAFWDGLRSGETQTAEYVRLGKGGRHVFIQASYIPILGPSGKPYKVVKYATDLTAQKLETERLVNAERERILLATQRSRSALDAATTPIMSVDENLNVIYLNQAMKEYMKRYEAEIRAAAPRFSLDSVLGSNIDIFHKDPQHQRRMLMGLKEPAKARIKLGSRILDQVVVMARDDAGKTIGYSAEWIDQTEEILAQGEVENVLKGAVAGDLTHRLDTSRYKGFIHQVAEGMNGLLDSVSDSFSQIKAAVEQIGQAAAQLLTTSQMMSSSAVQLNRAAEDSSDSLGKAAEMVRANAENAAMANQLVMQTSNAAQDGQVRMRDMSAAMGEINGSAQQIAKIIKVIDEIAFQTNLLALNAAVEAARAGRHGKGFAVVAQEVRSLAERSAKAAKETAELIETSVSKVTQGVSIAEATRGALDAILANVVKVVDLAGEIATASEQQSQVLATVSESMTQVTENAQAGSQQSTEVASAAQEMGRQMEVLRDRVGAYKVLRVDVTKNLPAGLSPEVVEHLLQILASREATKQLAQPGQNDNGQRAMPALRRANGASEPKQVLPLDSDERGFGKF